MIAISKRAVIGILLALALVVGMAGFSVVEATVSAAPAAAKSTKAPMSQKAWDCYEVRSQLCVKQFGYKNGTKAWGYKGDKYGNNCTNYVAYRLSKNKMKAQAGMGHAGLWAKSARDRGLTVNHTPTVGAVAQWNGPGAGHVAYVDWVSADGKTVYVSEAGHQGYYPSMTGRSVLRKGKKNIGPDYELGWPSNFITFKKASAKKPATKKPAVKKPAAKKPAPKAVTAKVMAKTQKMSKATLNSKLKGWRPKGSKVMLKCYVRGQSVRGYYSVSFKGGWDNLWYKVSDGYYTADVDLYTGSNRPVTKKC
jgi:hypothetical protein